MARRKHNGMNWIRQEKRLAIHLRDGLSCGYCGAGLEDGITFTLDHVIPVKHGGGNQATNLITCCLTCNSSKQERSLVEFAAAVANYRNHGVTADDIIEHVAVCTARPLPMAEAKAMKERRGSCAKAIEALRG